MSKLFQIIIFISANLIVGCSQVLQTVDLRINTEDSALQEQFSVVEKTLTIEEARKQKKAPYKRIVLQSGRERMLNLFQKRLLCYQSFQKVKL